MTFGSRSNTSHNGVSNEVWDATVDGFQRAAQTLSVGDVRKAKPDDTLRLARYATEAHVMVGLGKLHPARARRSLSRLPNQMGLLPTPAGAVAEVSRELRREQARHQLGERHALAIKAEARHQHFEGHKIVGVRECRSVKVESSTALWAVGRLCQPAKVRIRIDPPADQPGACSPSVLVADCR